LLLSAPATLPSQIKPKLEVWFGVDHLRGQLFQGNTPFVDLEVREIGGSAISFEDMSGGLTLSILDVSILDLRPNAPWKRVLCTNTKRSGSGAHHATQQPRSVATPSALTRETTEEGGWGELQVVGTGVSEALQRLQGARGLRIDAEGRSLKLLVALDRKLKAMLMDDAPIRALNTTSRRGMDGPDRVCSIAMSLWPLFMCRASLGVLS